MPLVFEDFPNKDYARQFVAQVKHRWALDGTLYYDCRDDKGERLEDWVQIERPLSKNGRKLEGEIIKLGEEYGGTFTGT